ncbi:hypothetical protein BDZ89DRAFT_678654 [Hymenopellis radicata]|nr:hypothetical protein BDZ89DRAFT_678654 [Hymenopellis radicata]
MPNVGEQAAYLVTFVIPSSTDPRSHFLNPLPLPPTSSSSFEPLELQHQTLFSTTRRPLFGLRDYEFVPLTCSADTFKKTEFEAESDPSEDTLEIRILSSRVTVCAPSPNHPQYAYSRTPPSYKLVPLSFAAAADGGSRHVGAFRRNHEMSDQDDQWMASLYSTCE